MSRSERFDVAERGAAGGAHPERMEVHGPQREELVAGGLRILADQEAEHAQERADEQPDALPPDVRRGRVGEQRVERGATRLPVRHVAGGASPGAAPARLGVEHHAARRRARAVAGASHAPAEVDVVEVHRKRRVEPVELVPDVAAHQHAGLADGEHVARPVVLTGIGLAGLEPGLAGAGVRDRQPDLEQPAQRRPLADLGADDRDVVGGRRDVEQAGERAGEHRGVVVEEPDPVGARHRLDAETDGLAEARAGRRVA